MRGTICAVLMSVVIAGCGGSTDYLGESPSEAGDDLAKSSCDTAFECGVLAIHCGSPNTATIMTGEEFYGTQADCERSLSMTYTDLFTGCAAANLTDAEANALNDCLNSGGSCPSESDYQAIADAVCSGQQPPNAPESCQQASSVLSRCSECVDNPC